MEAVLHPKPPLPSLSPSDYLDALVTVREKLSALHLMLLEYCTYVFLFYLWDDFKFIYIYFIHLRYGNSLDEEDIIPTNESFISVSAQRTRDQQEKELLEMRQKNEELQTFLEDQVAQVFQTYLRDYFQKETSLLRLNLILLLLYLSNIRFNMS